MGSVAVGATADQNPDGYAKRSLQALRLAPALHFTGRTSSLSRLTVCHLVLVSQEVNERMRKWQCIVCGWIYDEAEGCDQEDVAPGTKWEDVPADFVCPECGVSKEDFEMIEIG